MNSEEHIQLLNHLKCGYENSQQVIKAIDAKAGIISALTLLIISGLISVSQWTLDEQVTLRYQNTAHFLFCCLLVGILVLCLIVSLLSNIQSVVGRRRNCSFHILFPLHPSDEIEHANRIMYDDVASTHAFQITEYREQLMILGRILEKKVKYTSMACLSLQASLFTLVILMGVYFVPLFIQNL